MKVSILNVSQIIIAIIKKIIILDCEQISTEFSKNKMLNTFFIFKYKITKYISRYLKYTSNLFKKPT